MQVGTLVLSFPIPGARSLKDKRSVIRRVIARTRDRFNVSAAEVEAQDRPGTAVLGIGAVSESRRVVEETLDAVLRFIEGETGVDVAILEREVGSA